MGSIILPIWGICPVKKGRIRPANGIPGTMKNLIFMKETMDELCPGSTWSCFGVGHSALTRCLTYRFCFI